MATSSTKMPSLVVLAGLIVVAFHAVCAFPATAQVATPEKRIALVIGNARYPKVPLSNPENDARLVSANLRKLGFDVSEQLNLGVLQFRRALREFARRVQEDDAIAVFYYAGHGVQIDGRNYLLPVDIDLRDQEEVKDESVDIEELLLSRIERARSFPRIVILDACRDNPFARQTRNIRSAGGLAEMGARGTLIAFASAPGAPAEDGPDGRNSVYTRHLAQEMMAPGLEVEQMFKNVRVKVLRDTQQRQLPWVNTSLTSNFSFNPGGTAAGSGTASIAANNAANTTRPTGATLTSPREAQARTQPLPAQRTPPPFQPNELEQQLERARRDRQEALANPPAAPLVLAAPASRPPELAAPASIKAPAEPALRRFLDRAELQALIVGKTHVTQDLAAGGQVRWDLRSNGLVFYNSEIAGRPGSNGSGRWELKDDGSLCARFNAPPGSARLSDARRPDNGCWQYFRAGDKMLRLDAAMPQAPAEAVTLQ